MASSARSLGPVPGLGTSALQQRAQRLALEAQRPGDGGAQVGQRRGHRRRHRPLQRARGRLRQPAARPRQQPGHRRALLVAEVAAEQRGVLHQRDAAQDHRRVDEGAGQRRRQHRLQVGVVARQPLQRVAPRHIVMLWRTRAAAGRPCRAGSRCGRAPAARCTLAAVPPLTRSRGSVMSRPVMRDADLHAGAGLAGTASRSWCAAHSVARSKGSAS